MNHSNETPSDNQKERKGLDGAFASHYAMQVALQTMKERCQLLQQRLSSVEEDNLRLRIECQNNNREKTDASQHSNDKYEEQITQLLREKSQLQNRISMVAKENNKLWTRLSKLTEANQSLGDHMTKISDTLNKHPIGESSILIDSCQKLQKDDSVDTEESLEEISLKIIDGIKKEKEELEQQCKQMAELKTEAGVSIGECEFALNGVQGEGGSESVAEGVTDELRSLREKMRLDLAILKDQQTELKAAIKLLGGKRCKKCADRERKEKEAEESGRTKDDKNESRRSLLDISVLQRQLAEVAEPPPIVTCDLGGLPDGTADRMPPEGGFEERICPMCTQYYAADVPFDLFNDHVLGHFRDISEQDNEPDSIINRYELISDDRFKALSKYLREYQGTPCTLKMGLSALKRSSEIN